MTISSSLKIPVFPIRLQLRGSPYGNELYDVDGDILLSPSGDRLNVYNQLLQDEFSSGRLRLLHDIRIGYRYFITTQKQLDRFLLERQEGTEYFRRTYHIYQDEDFNYYEFMEKGVEIIY